MKKALLVLVSLAAAAPSFASSKVCAGERLYTSDVRADFGTQPPTGAHLSSHVIVFDREVLLKYDTSVGLHVHGVPPYRVTFEGEKTVLENVQEPAYHRTTYSVQAVLHKVNPLTQKIILEVDREYVVCREISNFVP